MPRRPINQKRNLLPDPIYNNVSVHMLINRVLKSGKKTVAFRIVYEAFKEIQTTTGKNPVGVFETALENVTPKVKVKPRRRGGAIQLVPRLLRPTDQPKVAAFQWILEACNKKAGQDMVSKLKNEILDAYKNQGLATRKREEYHKLAVTNAMYARKPQNIINAINQDV